MKKVLFSLLAMIGLGFAANKATAQTATKIGFFDTEQMAQALPEFKDVQAKMNSYNKASLGAQRDQLDTLLTNAQKTYTNDSLAKKSSSILAYDRKQVQDLYLQSMQWQQNVQQAQQNKYYTLMQPLLKKVNDALVKVAKENHITIVLKPDATDGYIDEKQVTNMFIPVAKELGVNINQQDTSSGATAPAAGK